MNDELMNEIVRYLKDNFEQSKLDCFSRHWNQSMTWGFDLQLSNFIFIFILDIK